MAERESGESLITRSSSLIKNPLMIMASWPGPEMTSRQVRVPDTIAIVGSNDICFAAAAAGGSAPRASTAGGSGGSSPRASTFPRQVL
jgi:hypothetical protein